MDNKKSASVLRAAICSVCTLTDAKKYSPGSSTRRRTTAVCLKAALRQEWNLPVFWAAGHHRRRSPRLFLGKNSIKRSIPAGMERLSRTDCPPALPFFLYAALEVFPVSTSDSEQNSTPLEHF